jgi:Ca2+-transporting ATPase
LNKFGGVKQLVVALETDAKDGVNGSEADLIYRKNVFGANKYKMRPPKCSLIFVIEALKNTTLIVLLLAVMLFFLPCSVHGIIQWGWKDGSWVVR